MVYTGTFIKGLVLFMLSCHVKGAEKVTVDAAMKFKDDEIVLIVGDNFLTLKNKQEVGTGKTSELSFPENINVKAAYQNAKYNYIVYLYASDFYYDVDPDEYFRLEYNRRSKRKFFGDTGPDAAAMRGGKVFFFKGCVMVEMKRWARHKNVQKFGLPCEPDAAWTTDNGMVVLKGDQIWVWDDGKEVDGPKDFSSEYTMTSWELIPSSTTSSSSNTGSSNTGNSNTDSSNTGNSNTGSSNTGNSNTDSSNTGSSNTGSSNTDSSNAGNSNTDSSNTGSSNTDSSSSGSNTGSSSSSSNSNGQRNLPKFNLPWET